MPSTCRRELARVAADSAAHIASAHISCSQSTEHILASRRAISRSLDLLLATYSMTIDVEAAS